MIPQNGWVEWSALRKGVCANDNNRTNSILRDSSPSLWRGFLHEELLHGAVLSTVIFSSERFPPRRLVSSERFPPRRPFLHGETPCTARSSAVRFSPRRGSLHRAHKKSKELGHHNRDQNQDRNQDEDEKRFEHEQSEAP